MSEQTANAFFERPILNSPYEYPGRHWELDGTGQPTQRIIERRRDVSFITPIPKPRKRGRAGGEQAPLALDEGKGLSSADQEYDPTSMINLLRTQVDRWRELRNPVDWHVTPETARLLQHWRSHPFSGNRPFFCQIEAAETAIWLTEVAPHTGKTGRDILDWLERANESANPDLFRIALKLATGAGKTTVMAMLIAWQTVNAVRRPGSKRFTRGFLVVTPGITIKDRLRVLQPNAPDNYYKNSELVPPDMLPDLGRAEIIITNYHAFKLRETVDISRGGRALLEGRVGPRVATLETEGQMIQRVMPSLMGMKNILVLNDEAHHCYREKPKTDDEEPEVLKGDDLKEAKDNNEAARLWISGLEAVRRKLGISTVFDLSATPFFLRGSGYAEGTLFPWTMSNFSLMDAIECGIVKLPRVPVSETHISTSDMPMFRDLWKHVGKDLPKAGLSKAGKRRNPRDLPARLCTALDALYGHYQDTFQAWEQAENDVPPCFIIVCANTQISKLVAEYISGYWWPDDDGIERFVAGKFDLFSNFTDGGAPLGVPRTLLIDSVQLESGDALDAEFRAVARDEIERFRNERRMRTGTQESVDDISDQDLLREVMNTVGKPGQMGAGIRCVVSVSMLTEGWDARNVTHILGIRAFETQLLCEQVVGRALRRQSYELNQEDRFDVEYADILGVPFNFTSQPTIPTLRPPKKTIRVEAMSPERDRCEIIFPNVRGYRIELPTERLEASFDETSTLRLDPTLIGPPETRVEGIVGEGATLTLEHLKETRPSAIIYRLTERLLSTRLRDADEAPKYHLFADARRIVREWITGYLICEGGTEPAQLAYPDIADMACNRIVAAITRRFEQTSPIHAVLDPFNSYGSTRFVGFNTSNERRWGTDSRKCHVNWVILDSDWESEFCRVVEAHPRVRAYVKNHGLGLEVPYQYGSESRIYRPDFIVLVDDGHGDPLHLVVEIKGYRREDAKEKKSTMETYWVPGVNNLGTYGRWAFAEFTDVYAIQSGFEALVEAEVNKIIEGAIHGV